MTFQLLQQLFKSGASLKKCQADRCALAGWGGGGSQPLAAFPACTDVPATPGDAVSGSSRCWANLKLKTNGRGADVEINPDF